MERRASGGRTVNGPLSLALPEKFRSGVRLETSGHGPISCRPSACAAATTDSGLNRRTLQFNGSGDTVRISTVNGPISVSGGERHADALRRPAALGGL